MTSAGPDESYETYRLKHTGGHMNARHAASLAVLFALMLWDAGETVSAAERGRSAAGIKNAIERVIDRAVFAPTWWGVEVRSLSTGRVLYARNEHKNLKPASSLKLVTTAAAL